VLYGVRLQEPLQGVRVRLTLAEHDGDDQSYKEHEADASKGSPDENLTVQIQNVLTACSCRKEGERGKRKGPPPSCGDVQLWQSHREVLQHRRLVVNVCEERASTEHRGRGGDQACPGDIPSCGVLLWALCWGVEGREVARSLLMSPSGAKTSAGSKCFPFFWCCPVIRILVHFMSPQVG